jgi:hypothetical protein
MKVKLLEVRDAGTFIATLAIDMNPEIDSMYVTGPGETVVYRDAAQRYLLRRVGYPCDGRPNIAITRLGADGRPMWNDPYGWCGIGRTFPVAHKWIIEHWAELSDGDVVDVEYILGERAEPKKSERETVPL